MSYGFSILQYFLQRLGAQYVAQRCRCQQSRRILGIFHIGNRYDGIENAKVNDGIHRYGHGVFGQYLLGRHVERYRSQVNHNDIVYARQNEKQTRAFGASLKYATQSEYDRSFVFFNNLFVFSTENINFDFNPYAIFLVYSDFQLTLSE
jgi:hypothetical protein